MSGVERLWAEKEVGGVLSLGSLREASWLGFLSLFGHRGEGATAGAPGGQEPSVGWAGAWGSAGAVGVSGGRPGARALWELSRVLNGLRGDWLLPGLGLGAEQRCAGARVRKGTEGDWAALGAH